MIEIFAFVFFILLIILNTKRKKIFFCSSNWLLSIYAVAFFSTIVYVRRILGTEIPISKYLFSALFILLVLFGFLLPFIVYNERKPQDLVIPRLKVLNIFSSVLIVLSLFSIIKFASAVNAIFSMPDLGDARLAMSSGEASFVEKGIANTIASVSASMYVFTIALFFIYLAIGGNKYRTILLFVSSFSYVVNILAFVGRDGVVFWLFSFVFCYLLFKDYITVSRRRTIKIVVFIAIILVLIPFVLISRGRFGVNVFDSYISYLGQPFYNALLFFGHSPMPYDHGHAFPLIFELTGRPVPPRIEWAFDGTTYYTFGLFIRELALSLGMNGLCVLCLVVLWFFLAVMKRSRRHFSYSGSFIYLLFFQVYSQGVFYFRQMGRGGNLFILICVFLFLFFRLLERNHGTVVIHKLS